MTNLSKRAEKAKALQFTHNPHEPGKYGTWGSKDSKYGQKYYQITLTHSKTTINTPDGQKPMVVLQAQCLKDTGTGQTCNCPGNERHTVCYHSLGAIWNSFKDVGKLVSFFETHESASRMSFGGKVVKVQSVQGGNGFVWATIKDWPKPTQVLSNNIDLMRGSEDDEGID